MDLAVGNANDAESAGTGWFVGFSDWTGSGLLHVPKDQNLCGLCIKWYNHPSGDDSGEKPVSEGRTLSILVSSASRFTLEFSESPQFDSGSTRTVVLQRQGDYAAWGAGLHHRWHCDSPSTILTVRWNIS